MIARVPVVAVGCSSLFLDRFVGDAVGERHVVFCDLDSQRPALDPAGFRAALQVAMREFNVATCYVFRTLKGYHVVAFDLMSRRETERFEERLDDWGSDRAHRFLNWRNGGSVLRCTPKPGEERGPEFVRTIVLPDRRDYPRQWSAAHFYFFHDLHGARLPLPAQGLQFANHDAKDELRLERYSTTAQVKAQ